MTDAIYTLIGWTMLHSLWQISLIVLLVYLVLNSGILKQPNTKFLFASISVGAIGILALSTFIFYSGKVYGNQSQTILQIVPLTDQKAISSTSFSLFKWLDQNTFYLSIAWISGFIVYSVKLIGGLSYLGYIKKHSVVMLDPLYNRTIESIISRTGKNKRITIFFSEKILSPITFGLYRISIVLPLSYINQLSPRETEIILAHEIAHIMRFDFLINLLVNIIKTFFYFHPGIWYLVNIIDTEREKATDLLACGYCDADTLEYAKVLLKAQEISGQNTTALNSEREIRMLALPFFKTKKQLLSRIEHILGKNTQKNQWIHRLIAFAMFTGIFILLSFTQIHLTGSTKILNLSNDKEAADHVFIPFMDDYKILSKEDSSTVELVLEIETEKFELADKTEHNINTDSPVNMVIKPVRKVEPTAEKDSEIINEPPNQQNIVIRQYIEQYFDPQDQQDEGIVKKFKTREAILIQVENELKTIDSINFHMDIWTADEFFVFPSIDEQRSMLNESLNLFRERVHLKDSLIRHRVFQFNDGFFEDFSWNGQVLKTVQPGSIDSLIYRFRSDGHPIEKLKMEVPHHFKKFRIKDRPGDEDKILKIIYLEG